MKRDDHGGLYLEYLHPPVLWEGGEEKEHGKSVVDIPQGIREGGISEGGGGEEGGGGGEGSKQ